MIPVEAVFLRFPRLVRDLSTKLGKQVDLELVGQGHRARPHRRRRARRPARAPRPQLARPRPRAAGGAHRRRASRPTGTLEIAARHAGGNVVITVRDDGRGIDAPRVAAQGGRARPDHAPTRLDSIDMARAAELLFAPGFSHRREHERHLRPRRRHGRGAHRRSASSAATSTGASEPGSGTTAQIRLPLTLAIMAALLVEIDGGPFAIPLDRVERTVQPRRPPRALGRRRPMLVLDDGVLPLLDAGRRARRPGRRGRTVTRVIVRGGRPALRAGRRPT